MTKHVCAVIGDGGEARAAGKTSLVQRLKRNEFNPRYFQTMSADYDEVSITSANGQDILEIWDVAGHDQYRYLRSTFIQGADIVFYCVDFSIEQPDIEKIKQEIKVIKGGDGLVGQAPNATVILVATKCDLYPDNAQTSVEQLARDVGVDFSIITSARTGVGFVEGLGQTLTGLIANLPGRQDRIVQSSAAYPERLFTSQLGHSSTDEDEQKTATFKTA